MAITGISMSITFPIILTNDSTGAKNYLPYTLESNDIDLDITAGFAVHEN